MTSAAELKRRTPAKAPVKSISKSAALEKNGVANGVTTGVKASSRNGRSGSGWQAEKSAMTRTAILDAAIRCFVRDGYSKTTTAMIASEAGVSRGAMMHHFPSRSAVMHAVVTYLRERRLAEYRELMADIDNQDRELSRADIRKSVKAAWDYVNLPSFIAYQELHAAARTEHELRQSIEEVERDFEAQFFKTVQSVFPHWKKLKSLQAAHDLVQFVMSGMALSYRFSNRNKRAERVIDLVTDQLLQIYEIEQPD